MLNESISGRAMVGENQALIQTTVTNVYDMSDPAHPKRLDHILAGLSVLTFTHTKTGTVHQLTGKDGAEYISFTASADYQEGDSWELNGVPLEAVNFMNGEPLCVGGLIAGDTVMGRVTDGVLTLFLDRPTSNPNLLDNSYFPDPVNQRGLTVYEGSAIYSIDRWLFNQGKTSLTVGDGSISITTFANTPWDGIIQRIEKPKITSERTFTLSVLLSTNTDIGLKLLYESPRLSDFSVRIPSDSSGLFRITGTLPSNSKLVSVQIVKEAGGTSNGTITVRAMKLEPGPRQTLAHKDAEGNWVLNDPPPNKQQELAKCQRYYEPFTFGRGYGIAESTTRLVIFLPYLVQKRTTPTFIAPTDINNALYLRATNNFITPDSISTIGIRDGGILLLFTGTFQQGKEYWFVYQKGGGVTADL